MQDISGRRAAGALTADVVAAETPLQSRLADTPLGGYFGLRVPGLLCPPSAGLSAEEGYFTFRGVVCYGRCRGKAPSRHIGENLPDVSDGVELRGQEIELPFDLEQVLSNFRLERYRQTSTYIESIAATGIMRSGYYAVRPWLAVAVRRHLQKLRLLGWSQISFPAWPVDVSVERLMSEVLRCVLEQGRIEQLPFIWFWPDGATACAVMTHDVEGTAGREFCPQLMDLDDAYGIPAAFQVIPDKPGATASGLFERLRARGFEVNVHDLTHDGSLFADAEAFAGKAAQINEFAARFGSRGFRSGSMYRELEWFDAFEFSYDMSVPNVAHLEPQRGGCCTVMPYFVGKVLELPLTTTQDYSLFHILGDYSTALWRQQIDVILEYHGLMSFIAHPDYLIEPRARSVYVELLGLLRDLRQTKNVWIAQPGMVDSWWRSRRAMTLARSGSGWRITGPDSGRARLAIASLRDGQVAFRLADQS